MSIIRNSTTTGDYGKKLVSFLANGQIPKSGADGSTSGSGWYAHTHANVNGYALIPGGYCGANDLISIWANIPSGADGYFFGHITSTASQNVWLRKSGQTIYYKWGSGAEVSVAYQAGWHVYSFVPSGNGVLFYFDNTKLSNTVYQHGWSRVQNVYRIGAAYNATSSSTSSISGLLIRRVIVGSYVASTGSKKRELHYYPASNGVPASTSTCGWYECREAQAIVSGSNVMTGSGEAAKYGIGLDEVKSVFGCSYGDLIANITEDGGCDSLAGFSTETAKEADRLQYTDGSSQVICKSAFALGNGSSSRSNIIPLPSGVTLLARVSDTWNYTRGDLLYGRRPKWSIWNDKIKFGFYVKTTALVTHQLMFNIYKFLKESTNNDIRLEMMDGVSNGSNYAPAISVPKNGWVIEFNNHLPYKCAADTLAIGYITDESNYDKSKMIFVLSTNIDGDVTARAGNAIPWNYTLEELQNTEMAVFGYAVSVKAFASNFSIINAVKCGNIQLSSETSAEIKAEYKTTWSQLSAGVSTELARLLYDRLYEATDHTVTATATMSLVNANVSPASIVTDNLITMERLMAPKVTSLTGQFNNAFRIFIDYHLEQNTYAGIQASDHYENDFYHNQPSGIINKALHLSIIPCSTNATAQLIEKNYYAVWECYEISSNVLAYRSGIKKLLDFDEFKHYKGSTDSPWHQWWRNQSQLILSLNYNGAVVYKGSQVIQGSTYARHLMLENEEMTGGYDDLQTSTSIVLHIYDSSTAPILLEPQTGLWQETTQSVYQDIGTQCWLYSKPYTLNTNIQSYIGQCLVREYALNAGVWSHDPSKENKFKQNVELYKNDTLVATFHIDFTASGATGQTSQTVGNYTITIRSGYVFEGYWYDPDGSFSYYGIGGFFQMQFNSTASYQAGDKFSTTILAYSAS